MHGQLERGVDVVSGAHATVARCAILANREVGVSAEGPGTELVLSDTVVADTLPADTLNVGYGLMVSGGAVTTATGDALVANRQAGVQVHGSGSHLSLSSSLLAETQPAPGEESVVGVAVVQGATAELVGSAIVETLGYGLFIAGPGTSVEATGNLVRGSGGGARSGVALQVGGVVAQAQAAVVLTGNMIVANEVAGVHLAGEGTTAALLGNLVADNRLDIDDHASGYGVWVDQGSHAVLEGNAIVGNQAYGVEVYGATLEASQNLVAATRMLEGFGTPPTAGLHAFGQAELVLTGNAVLANQQTGILISDEGTTLSSTGDLVADTQMATAFTRCTHRRSR